MQESAACAVLKARFEAAGFQILENQMFDEDGIRFEMDGFDAERRVGYEYVTEEAGDSWDVDDAVIAALAKRKANGELFVLVVGEADAPDEKALAAKADAFIADLPKQNAAAKKKVEKPEAKPPAKGAKPAKPPPTPAAKPPPRPPTKAAAKKKPKK